MYISFIVIKCWLCHLLCVSDFSPSCSGNGPKWVKVDEKRTLHDILKEPNLVIPGVPGIDNFPF